MANTAPWFNKASGIFFLTGFFTSKLQFLPDPMVAGVFRFLSLGLYLGGYSTWFLGSAADEGYKNQLNKWYGFAQLKNQYMISSLLGFAATVISIAAVFVPALFPPAAWLYAVANAIWAISEYHKSKNPPPKEMDPNYNQSQQEDYHGYAISITAISVVTAIAATLIAVFPLAAVPITIFSLLIGGGLGVLAGEFWFNATFDKHKPDAPDNSMKPADLEANNSNQAPSSKLQRSPDQNPVHYNPIFKAPNAGFAKPNTTSTPELDSQGLGF